jgi:hypothetical protein
MCSAPPRRSWGARQICSALVGQLVEANASLDACAVVLEMAQS